MKTILLNNGIEMPQQGFGTYLIPLELISKTIGEAYNLGYRMFDTAWRYKNEKAIRNALKENNIKREDIFITSKFNITGSYKSYSFNDKQYNIKYRSIKSVIQQSLDDLGTDYIDLYLIHFPYPMYKKIWEVMNEFYEAGKIRAIGVCSFLQPHLMALESVSNVVPAVNQFEISPLNTQKELIEYCHNRHIAVEAMSTFSHYRSIEPRAEILENSILKELAVRHHKSVVQIVLRWMYQQDIILIPKSWNYKHMQENIDILDFELSQEEMYIIDSLDSGKFLNYNPFKSKQGFEKFWKEWENLNNKK